MCAEEEVLPSLYLFNHKACWFIKVQSLADTILASHALPWPLTVTSIKAMSESAEMRKGKKVCFWLHSRFWALNDGKQSLSIWNSQGQGVGRCATQCMFSRLNICTFFSFNNYKGINFPHWTVVQLLMLFVENATNTKLQNGYVFWPGRDIFPSCSCPGMSVC